MNSLRPLQTREIGSTEARVDIAPLVDVVFLLLIFFVISATLARPSAVPIERPTARQADPLPQRPVVVTITGDGDLWLGDKPFPLGDGAAIKSALSNQEEKRVLIHADGEVPTRRLVSVIDRCREAGAERIDLAADPEGRGRW